MALARPTLAELVDRVRGDFRARLGISGSLVRRAMSDVLATVWAGTVHMLHGHLEYAVDQLFGDTAEREFLIRLASKYGLTITPAQFATGTVTVIGAGLHTIDNGEILVRDDGETFTVTALTIFTGSGTLPVQATTAGAIGNMESGDVLAFESPVAGVDSEVTVIDISGGTDEEGTEDFRARYMLRRRSPPTGGSDQDYEGWALAVAGVTRAWVARHEDGLGTATIRFVLDNETDIFPSVGKVAEVQAAIDAQRPTTAEPLAAAPIRLDVGFTISLANDTATTRTAIEAELADLLYRVGEPGDNIAKGELLLSSMRTAVGSAADGDYTLSTPSADVLPGVGVLLVLGVVTWV